MSYLVSLCIPTDGNAEWVRPVVDSIYSQGVSDNEFEVVICDNGKGSGCRDRIISDYGMHQNLRYITNDAIAFMNQIKALKSCHGSFVKFINSRCVLLPGSLEYLISYAKEYSGQNPKPIIYFDQQKNDGNSTVAFDNFDGFVACLSYMSSYSGGISIWKEDLDVIDADNISYTTFPHLKFLFYDTDRKHYIIDKTELFREIPHDETKKVKYNIFFSFGVEYLSIILDLYVNNKISIKTFNTVKSDNGNFLEQLFFRYCVLKKPCSYLLSNAEDYLNVFYNYHEIREAAEKMANLYDLTESDINNLLSKKIYLYGAGDFARRWYAYLQKQMLPIESFVVSSRKDNPSELLGLKVKELSDIQDERDIIVIPALEKGYDDVVELLRQNKIDVFEWKK